LQIQDANSQTSFPPPPTGRRGVTAFPAGGSGQGEGRDATASRSFKALAQFQNGTFPVWLAFVRVTSDGVTVVKIAGYKFGAK
jgi:hypothetical protein